MRFLPCLLLLCACSAPAPQDTVDGAALLEAWRSEIIALPPQFAPSLPAGEEELRFAPGMYDAQAEDYWSYAYVLRLAEPVAHSRDLLFLLEAYYDGLITAVASGKDMDVGSDPATVQLQEEGEGRYWAQVDLIDAFVTGEPLRVHMQIDTSTSTLRAAASPQPRDHPLWRELLAVRDLL